MTFQLPIGAQLAHVHVNCYRLPIGGNTNERSLSLNLYDVVRINLNCASSVGTMIPIRIVSVTGQQHGICSKFHESASRRSETIK